MNRWKSCILVLALLAGAGTLAFHYCTSPRLQSLLHRTAKNPPTPKPRSIPALTKAPLTAVPSNLPTDPQIAQIDAYCNDLDAFQAAHAKEAILVASIDGDYRNNLVPTPWKPFPNDDAVQKLFDGGNAETYDQANVLTRDGHVVLAYAVFSDPTGDWIIYATYYFQTDGKLVRISSQLNTFEGEMTVLRDTYFSPEGRQLREDTQFFTMKDHKKLDKPNEDFIDFPTPRFLSVDVSPFRGASTTQTIISSK